MGIPYYEMDAESAVRAFVYTDMYKRRYPGDSLG